MSSTDRLRLDMTPHEREARQYAERVYRTLVALEPLYDVPQAIEWLASPQAAMNDQRPVLLLGLHSGTQLVREKIALILDGAFS